MLNIFVRHAASRISFPFSQWRDSWTFNARKCEVIITDKRVNLGDKKGMQVTCEFQFVGKENRICFLSKIRSRLEKSHRAY